MNDTHAENGSGPASWVRWMVATAIGVLVAFAGFVVIFEIFGEPDHLLFPLLMTAVGVVFGAFQQRVLRHALVDVKNWALVTGLAPVVAAAVTGVALVRLTRPGDRSRTDHLNSNEPDQIAGTNISTGRSSGRSNATRTPSALLAIAPLLVLFLGACADDSSSSAPEPASSTDRAAAETNAAAPGSVADVAAEAGSSQVCTLVSEMYEQDDLPSIEQLQRYQQLAPDAIADQVTQVADALIADGGDPTSFFNIIAADNNEAAIAEIDAWEEKTCGVPHSADTALPAGASRELDPDATRVDVHTTEYAFHVGDVAPGRTSFVLTNDGDETHEMLIIKLASGVTLDEAMQAEGGGGTVEESWTTNLAAPGDDEVITFDVEPGEYGLLCFILNADGTLHALLGMQHQLTVH